MVMKGLDAQASANPSPVYTYCHTSHLEKTSCTMEDIFAFLFQTREGFALLFVVCLIISIVVAFVLERRTHKLYVDRGPKSGDDDDWTL